MTASMPIERNVPSNPAQSVERAVRPVRSLRPALSLVLPTRNEAENIEELVARIERAVDGESTEVIFVDDSTDATPGVIRAVSSRCSLSISLIHRPPESRADGLAGAVVLGLRAAKGRWVCVMDADLQHPPELVRELLGSGESREADLVIASRYLPGASSEGLGSTSRRMISLVAKWISKALFFDRLRRISDPCAGFFLVRRELINEAELRPVGFKILLEILMRTSWQRVEEVPCLFARRVGGDSKATFAQGKELLRHLLRLLREVPSAGRLWKFALVGTTGVLVNLGMMAALMVLLGTSRWLGWAFALEVSVIWNFCLNNYFTWSDRQRRPGGTGLLKGLGLYHAVSGISLAVNAIVFAVLSLTLAAPPLLAAFLAILPAAAINFGGANNFVFVAASRLPPGVVSTFSALAFGVSSGPRRIPGSLQRRLASPESVEATVEATFEPPGSQVRQ